jgi:hypothetical protein
MNQNDPNIGRRVSQPVMKRANDAGWIIGIAVAVVIILGLFVMYDRSGPAATTGAITTPAPPAR